MSRRLSGASQPSCKDWKATFSRTACKALWSDKQTCSLGTVGRRCKLIYGFCAVLCCAVLCCAVLCKLLHLAILSRQRHMPSCSRCPVYTYDRMERACAVSDDGARRCVLHSFLMAASQSWRSQCSLSMHCFHDTGPCLVSCEYLGHLNSDQKMSV